MHYKTYINVGIWRSVEDFDKAISPLIPQADVHPKDANKRVIEIFDFEYKQSERIVMKVDKMRNGDWLLPDSI